MYLLKDIESEIQFRLLLNNESLESMLKKLEIDLYDNKYLDQDMVMDFANKVAEFKFDHVGLSSDDYLKHPINVGRLVASYADNIDESYVHLALVHNLIEVGGKVNQKQLSIISPDIIKDIEILTVDRSKQWDWGYKDVYYKNIQSSDRASCIKIFDKLDNIFLIQQNKDKEIRKKYMYEIEEFLMPMAKKRVPNLVDYMNKLTMYCKD